MGYAGEDRERYAYLDLLATALTDHEKNLNELIRRLDKVCLELSSIVEPESKEQSPAEETPYRGRETLETLLKAARDILLE